MKIDLSISYRGQSLDVVAELVADLAPHLPATFAVHRTPEDPRCWNVTNIETGYRIGEYETSRKAAIEAAREKLAGKSPDVFARQMEKARRVAFAKPISKPRVTESTE